MVTLPGARPITAPGWTGQPRLQVGLIDCDVHQGIEKPDDLHPYRARVYKQQLIEQGLRMPSSGYFNVPQDAARTDLAANCDGDKHNPFKDGGAYETLRDEHLDVWDVDHALLTGASTYGASVLPDPDFAAALCRAFNDWTLEHWVARDERLLMALAIATGDPQLAVQEIARLGDNPRVRAILLPTGNRLPYGNRFYHPIWEACERHGLVVGIHPGNEGAGAAGPPTGVGYPTYYIETRMARPQMAMAHAVSLIAEGVFATFPRLKVLFDECDQFWLAGLMWHMDADWKSLRDQTPWVRRLPSEYVLEHIRVGSQPMLEAATSAQFLCLLDAMHADLPPQPPPRAAALTGDE